MQLAGSFLEFSLSNTIITATIFASNGFRSRQTRTSGGSWLTYCLRVGEATAIKRIDLLAKGPWRTATTSAQRSRGARWNRCEIDRRHVVQNWSSFELEGCHCVFDWKRAGLTRKRVTAAIEALPPSFLLPSQQHSTPPSALQSRDQKLPGLCCGKLMFDPLPRAARPVARPPPPTSPTQPTCPTRLPMTSSTSPLARSPPPKLNHATTTWFACVILTVTTLLPRRRARRRWRRSSKLSFRRTTFSKIPVQSSCMTVLESVGAPPPPPPPPSIGVARFKTVVTPAVTTPRTPDPDTTDSDGNTRASTPTNTPPPSLAGETQVGTVKATTHPTAYSSQRSSSSRGS